MTVNRLSVSAIVKLAEWHFLPQMPDSQPAFKLSSVAFTAGPRSLRHVVVGKVQEIFTYLIISSMGVGSRAQEEVTSKCIESSV